MSENCVLQYINGYLEAMSGLNTHLSETDTYSFWVEETASAEVAEGTEVITFAEMRYMAAGWFFAEADDSLNEAMDAAAENWVEMLEIELIKNKPYSAYLLHNDDDRSEVLLSSEGKWFRIIFEREIE